MNTQRYGEFLSVFALERIVDARSINLLETPNKRAEFIKFALREGHLKEQAIVEEHKIKDGKIGGKTKWKRLRAKTTVYTITKAGLRYLSENVSEFFDLTYAPRNMKIFCGAEYTPHRKKRMANNTAALLLAKAAGATIRAESLCYPKEEFNTGFFCDMSDPDGNAYTLKSYYTDFLPGHAYDMLVRRLDWAAGPGEEEDRIEYHTGAQMKHLISGASFRGTERDYARGRYDGVLDSHRKSILLYVAPSFTLSWGNWDAWREYNAMSLWMRTYSLAEDKAALRKGGVQAALVVKNSKEFEDNFRQKYATNATLEPFGGRFSHVYIIPKSTIGAAHLNFILLVDEEWEKGMMQKMIVDGYQGENSNSIFPLRSQRGELTALGFMLDAKQLKRVIDTANHDVERQYRILCFDWQEEYYRRVLPPNIVFTTFYPPY